MRGYRVPSSLLDKIEREALHIGDFSYTDGMDKVIDAIKDLGEVELDNPWHTGTPTIDDPFLIKEVFILLFIHPSGETWNYHAHLFKPDFTQKCFYSWCDKRIKFSFNTEGLLWQKIEPYK